MLAEPFQNEHTVFWVSTLTCTFAALSGLFALVGPFKAKPATAAHHIAMFPPFLYLAYKGWAHWNTSSAQVPDSAVDRMFATFDGAACFSPTMLGLQIFDLTTTTLIPGMRKPDAIAHHAVALILAYHLTRLGFLQYWQPFYFGLLEASSVPLCFVDLFRTFPKVANKLNAVNELARVLFAASFLPVRCLYMPYVSYQWWGDFLR
jgi:hypothetical protein